MEVQITFKEHEARLLSKMVQAVWPYLTEPQREVSADIAHSFVIAAQKQIDALVEELGDPGATAWADQALAAHPESEEPIVIPGGGKPKG